MVSQIFYGNVVNTTFANFSFCDPLPLLSRYEPLVPHFPTAIEI